MHVVLQVTNMISFGQINPHYYYYYYVFSSAKLQFYDSSPDLQESSNTPSAKDI